MLEGYLNGRWCVVGRRLAPLLHLVPLFLVEGGVRGQECLNLVASFLLPPPPACLQYQFYLTTEVTDDYLPTCRISKCRDSHVNKPLHVHRDICVIPCLPCFGIWDRLPQGHGNSNISHRGGQGTEGGGRMHHLRYFVCSLRVTMRRHPMIM